MEYAVKLSVVCLILLVAGSAVAQCPNTCGNGVIEAGEECDDLNLDTGDGCDASCEIEPGVWICPPQWQGDGYCDCGCGLIDIADCYYPGIEGCEFCGGCNNHSLGCANIDPTNVAVCIQNGHWGCQEWHYGSNDGCDCGCGITDPDCADSLASSCEYYEGCGGPTEIEPTANHVCACQP